MEAKIRRLQGIIMRSQPQDEQNLRTIQNLEQVLYRLHVYASILHWKAEPVSLVVKSAACNTLISVGRRRALRYLLRCCVYCSLSHGACSCHSVPPSNHLRDCCLQELACSRAGSGAGMRRTSSQLPRQPTLDKGHIRTANPVRGMSSMPAHDTYGECGLVVPHEYPYRIGC